MSRLTIRNIVLAGTLILVLILVLITGGRRPFGGDQTQFAASPAEEITRIELSGDDKKLILEKADEKWIVNGSQEARKSAVSFILRVVTGIKIKSPVSESLFNDELLKNDSGTVNIRVFEKNKLLTSFIVYRTSSNPYGNFMKVRTRAKPFIVSLPGFEGDIGSVFTVNELYWLSYTVFNMLPSEISEVRFHNFPDTTESFKIIALNNRWELDSFEDKAEVYDTLRLMRYVSYFAYLPFESWAFDIRESEQTRITSEIPLYRITVRKVTGDEKVLTLWEKRDSAGNVDSDRIWGLSGGNSKLFILRYFDIDPIIKNRSWFLH
jgi:hypothetical protein